MSEIPEENWNFAFPTIWATREEAEKRYPPMPEEERQKIHEQAIQQADNFMTNEC